MSTEQTYSPGLAGVIAGSALWAPILVTAGGRFGSGLAVEHRRRLNQILGLVIALFGLGMGAAALFRHYV